MDYALSNSEASRLLPVRRSVSGRGSRGSASVAEGPLGLSKFFASLALQSSGETSEEFRGPFGLVPLSIPPEPMVDLVFVHGLGGGSRKTWSKGQNIALFWPKHWLSRDPDFQNVRIHSFGYDADWPDTGMAILDIHDFGNKLLTALHLSQWISRSAGLPIIFVAHSMGGLVVKQAYLLTQINPANEAYPALGNRFHTMFFLATPHQGADSAHLLSAILYTTVNRQRSYEDDLQTGSPAIQRINDSFKVHADNLQLFSFFETRPYNFGAEKFLIVNKSSAVMGLPNERSIHLDADHKSICTFDTPNDPNFLTVRREFLVTLDMLKQNWDHSNRDTTRKYKRQLRKYLGLTSETIGEDLPDFDEPRADGSCEWITEKPEFCRWRDETAGPVMTLFALPAMGKSYMADFVLEHLQSLGHTCSFFFFQADQMARTSLSRCLIVLAYNMACYIPKVRDAFLEMLEDDVHIESNQEKPRHIWQKLFASCILKQKLYRAYYWVIDALDECKDGESLMPLIAGIPAEFPLRVFITSRPSHDLQNELKRLRPPPGTLEISPGDALRDIKRYLEAQTSFLDHEQPKLRRQLINTILEKSEGCFLWVTLVLKELKEVQSSKITQRILQNIPKGMNKLYSRTLAEMSSAPASTYTKPLIKAILRWAVCSIRSLTVEELRLALMMDIDDEVQNLQRQIPSLCGHLLYVDSQSKVRLIHQTVKSFLVDPENTGRSEFALSEKDGHRHIASLCFKYLSSSEMHAPRARRPSHQHASAHSKFLAYAATCFYEHLRYCSAADEKIFHQLSSFLRDSHRNVLRWIEYIAINKDLTHLTRTGMILKTYLKRRAKHFPALGEDIKLVERWSVDLIRLITKFGQNLIRAPSAIFNIIPPFCPQESAIYALYGQTTRGISITGLSSASWDDRLASLAYPDMTLSSIACSAGHFAVGSSDKSVRLYNTSTCQLLSCLPHTESPRVLEFDVTGKLLLAVGRKLARVWDVVAEELVFEVTIPRACIAATFTADSHQFLLACLDNKIYTHSLLNKTPPLAEQLYTDIAHSKIISRPPDAAAFSLVHKLLAFVYRGGHINIWNWEENIFEGTCEKPDANTQIHPFHATSLVFNPQPEADTLAGAYEDGKIIIFNPYSSDIKAIFEADAGAATLACSVDGRTLISGDSSGTIRVFDFELFEKRKLKMFHVIYSNSENVQSLAFCDNYRFVDIRASQSNVWEPAALVRQERDDEVSDAVSVDLREHNLTKTVEQDEVTCIDLGVQGDFVFFGTEAGLVRVYGLKVQNKYQTIFNHGVTVTKIAYHHETRTLAIADSAGRAVAVRLSFSTERENWKIQSKLLKGGHRMVEPIEQLLFSPDGTHLHVVTTTQDDLCPLDGSVPRSLRWDTRNRGIWATNPANVSEMLLITCSKIRIYSWDNLEPITSEPIKVDVDLPPEFDLKAVYTGWSGRILITEYSDSIRARSKTRFYLWDALDLKPSTRQIRPHAILQSFGDRIAPLIGTLGTMIGFVNGNNNSILFLSHDGWVCSAHMKNELPEHYQRHFCLPNDWLSTNDEVLIRCTPSKEIIFVKEHEVAIIRNGLDCIELCPFNHLSEAGNETSPRVRG